MAVRLPGAALLKKKMKKVRLNKINCAAMEKYKKFLFARGALFRCTILSMAKYSNSKSAACHKLCNIAMQKLYVNCIISV